MIFRSIERRHLRIAFGEFLDEKALDRVMSKLSEWSCFKSAVLRWRWGPLGSLRRYIRPETLAAVMEAESKRATDKSKPGR